MSLNHGLDGLANMPIMCAFLRWLFALLFVVSILFSQQLYLKLLLTIELFQVFDFYFQHLYF